MKICVVGLGYIGIPTMAVLADSGHEIIGVDVIKEKVDLINKGKIYIEEPYIEEIIQKHVEAKNIKASTLPEKADAYIICVPTPIKKDKSADMSYVISAAEAITPYLSDNNIVVLESTSPPGTTKNTLLPILNRSNKRLYVGYSPERVFPGKILYELINNSRIIGGIDKESVLKIKEIYSSFVKGEIALTDCTSAEMAKLMENTYRDVNIALANEMAKVCGEIGVNTWDVIKLSNSHPRVNIYNPGPGVGGHCIAVDPWFVVEKAPREARIIKLSRQINDGMPRYVANIVMRKIEQKEKICIFGVAYKADVDDMRGSPIIELANILEDKGYEIRIYDPHISKYKELDNAVKDSALIIIGVDHKEFKGLDYEKLSKLVKDKKILDTRNCVKKKKVVDLGYEYYLLGDV